MVVAHRGASRHAPENSLAAAEKAIHLGADMIELDVRRTRDGVLVAHHDAAHRSFAIRDWSLHALRQTKPDVARLDDLLRLCAGRITLDLELKERGYEGDVLAMCRDLFPLDDLIVTSFQARSVMRVKELLPTLATGWIVGSSRRTDLLARFTDTGADWLVANVKCLNPDVVTAVHLRHVPVAVWTVNSWSEIEAVLHLPGLAAVITDVPDVARLLRDRRAGQEERLAAP